MSSDSDLLSAWDVPAWPLRTRLAAWSIPALLGALYAQSTITGKVDDPSPGRVTVVAMLTWLVWIPLTPIVTRFADRHPLNASVRRVAAHVLLAALAIAVQAATTAISTVVVFGVAPRALPALFGGWYLVLLPAGVIVYIAVIALRSGAVQRARLDFRTRQAERLGEQLRDTQLRALRAQLQPHFLFNTLTAITALVRDQETERASDALDRLSALLRSALRAGDVHEVPLEEEICWLRDYLAIEELRIGHEITLTVSIAPAMSSALVPSWILQPLVENAVRHGLRPRRGPGTVRISACSHASTLTIEVADDGVGLSHEWERRVSMGYGVANSRARLAQLYGDRGTLVIAPSESGGTTATLTLPQRNA